MHQLLTNPRYFVLAVCLLIGQSGCAVERSSVSIDSNSRSPWLGLQLLPSKKADTSSYHRPISRQSDAERDAVAVVPALETQRSEFRLPNWIRPSSPPESQQLPRTESIVNPEEDASGIVEF